MGKRKKRPNPGTKAWDKWQTTLREKELDSAWAKQIRERDGNKCAYCDSTNSLNAAHIIPREQKLFRWNLDNGILLCAKHHKWSFEFSVHQNPFAFLMWFSQVRKEQFERLKRIYYSYNKNETDIRTNL